MEIKRTLYPLTVVKDRYTGTYSGGEFTAWALEPEDVPPEIWYDDVPCMNFWWNRPDDDDVIAGRGKTPEEAIENLSKRLEKAGIEDYETFFRISKLKNRIAFMQHELDKLKNG